jgi:hypothetical protein
MHGMRHISEMEHPIYHAKTRTMRHASFSSHVAQLHLDFQFTYSSMMFLAEMKTKVKAAVESSYEFDTSQAPDSINHNASRAQALLTKMSFIYKVCLIAFPFSVN